VRGITTACRLSKQATRADVDPGVLSNFQFGEIIMKVSLIALVAGCAVASSAFAAFDLPPVVPPHQTVFDLPPVVPPHQTVFDLPPVVPPHAE
jgi:hypothetical protein